VRDWLRGRSSPTGSRAARLIELGEITDRLASAWTLAVAPPWTLEVAPPRVGVCVG